MSIELTLIADARGNLHTDSVLRELTRRRAVIEELDKEVNGKTYIFFNKNNVILN